jgi:DNA-binding transcriptional ArsR family regulator
MSEHHTPSSGGLAYLKFLNLVSAIRRIHPVLDPMEERLLNMVSAAWSAGHQVTVMEAMTTTTDASPATVHRRLKTLRNKGMLELQLDDTDNRVKYIVPTPKALSYFESLSQCMTQVHTG